MTIITIHAISQSIPKYAKGLVGMTCDGTLLVGALPIARIQGSYEVPPGLSVAVHPPRI